jgi:isoquinoline 1-oxidoreductase alpha subunit
MAYTIEVNGSRRVVDVDGDMPLLWALRDELELKGSKFGCGAGLCGACTVHIDGEPTRSCQIAISAVGTARVATIEGMAAHPVGKKLQAAWMELDVPQCGYCQAGQIMSATALLIKTPHPTDQDIDAAMSGNVCRCCSYTRIRAGIKHVAEAK